MSHDNPTNTDDDSNVDGADTADTATTTDTATNTLDDNDDGVDAAPDPLFETAVPDDTQQSNGEFSDLDVTDVGSDALDDWEHDESPITWLFGSKGRLKLCVFALEEVATGDPVFLNKTATSREADVSRHSSHRYLDTLVDLGVFETRGEGYNRYRPNANSRILQAMATLHNEISDHAAAIDDLHDDGDSDSDDAS